MPRPYWKGYLKLSLVSCAVALYNASSSSERVSFNTLNRKTGNRLKQNLVDSVNGEPVDTADRVKGYQFSKGQYVMVKDAEEAFAVIRDAMMKKKVAGIGRVVLSRRERLLMLHPRGKGMMATTLRYPYEVRQ